jgi:drug/metabolite transporter (DMT)-like permease
MSKSVLLFLLMSLIWGTTWIAIKAGVSQVPPLFFAGARFFLVAVTLGATVKGVSKAFVRTRLSRIIVTGLLVNVATYGLIFWGMRSVPSGVSGLTNLSFIAIGLFGFAILFGQEKPTWHYGLSLAAGLTGLVILFSDSLSAPGTSDELMGAAAIVIGTLTYCLGSVMAKPLLQELRPLQLTAAQAIVAAAGLPLLSLLLEPVSGQTFRSLASPAPLAGLLFLVIFGTFIAYTIYLRLVRDWGAPRAGLYAFTSPVIALLLGAIIYGEPFGPREITGAAVMLIAAAFAIRSRSAAMR